MVIPNRGEGKADLRLLRLPRNLNRSATGWRGRRRRMSITIGISSTEMRRRGLCRRRKVMTARQMTMSIGLVRRMIHSRSLRLVETESVPTDCGIRVGRRSGRRIDVIAFISNIGVEQCRAEGRGFTLRQTCCAIGGLPKVGEISWIWLLLENFLLSLQVETRRGRKRPLHYLKQYKI